MTYQESLTKHLTSYKNTILKIRESGTWGMGQYEHILPKARRNMNIVESIRDGFWQYAEREGLTDQLHTDFAHCNSSQAFAFNLFFPIFENQDAINIVLKFANLPEQRVEWEFEHIPDEDEQTNFDVLGIREDKGRILVEVKLSEREFGTCKLNDERKEKRDRIYRPRLNGKISEDYLNTDKKFVRNYQLLRNLSHLSQGDRLLLVLPRKNERTFQHAVNFQKDVLPEWKDSVVVIAAENLIEKLAQVPAISATMAEVRAKYVIA